MEVEHLLGNDGHIHHRQEERGSLGIRRWRVIDGPSAPSLRYPRLGELLEEHRLLPPDIDGVAVRTRRP